MLQFENGIPIKNFLGDKSDQELPLLTSYLKNKILKAPDVRDVISQDFLDYSLIQVKKKLLNIKWNIINYS